MGVLKGYAFITERKTADSFDIHRLVRLAMRNSLRKEERKEVITDIIRWLSQKFPSLKDNDIQVWLRCLPHAQEVLKFQDDSTN